MMVPVSPDPLRPLVDAAREGDDTALGALVRATQGELWRLCELLGSGDDVEDLVQETYLRAMRALPSYRGEAPVRAWLASIARHTCADQVRRRQRRRRLQERLAATEVLETHQPASDPTVPELLDHLDPDRREAFVLTQVLGMSYDEAAEVIGCPIGTVRSRVARARAELLGLVRQADAV